ncbi:MFS transporter [Streptomyces microflavus]|uniref:MFS transporter n=1 Tax=Streptomyces microflavus TaxID=1919 RepID=A0A6N9UZ75_STRMI|nr:MULTISPECIES: MFS transporter [Streptomyces]MBW3360723.1 MFS transporter [Streptomyces sp. 09ZI22]MEE1728098.1 MFS transporter [Streptomyces sp. BE282]NEB65723.1 MFS transporter [Streptomyces microflavus]QKW45052.1 MFS transporter [Streptomyces microflavus]QQZ56096.1 MFS transporter [Streptomyces microflavus]
MPPADTGASTVVVDASAPSSPVTTTAAPAGAHERLEPGRPGYRKMSFALFAAGVAAFALLYSTQALLPAISASYGVSAGQASWTVSAATGALALCVLPLSALSERFGRRQMMTASLTVAVLVGMLVPFAPSIGWLIALRAIQGAALAGLPASAMAYLAEEVRPKALIAAIGLFVAGNSIGGMSGRILTGWVAQAWGWRAALAAVGLLAVACAVAFHFLIPRARNFTPGTLNPKALAKTVATHLGNPLLVRLYAIGALFMTVFGAVYTVIGYRLVDEPFSLPQGIVGSIFLVYLVGTVSSAAAGRLVARLGRRGALYLAVSTTTAGLLLSLADQLASVLLGLVLITAGFFAGHAVASSSVSRTATTGRAQASALYQSAYYLGSSAGGTLGAVAFHAGGWAATVALGLLAVLGVVSITLYGTRVARAERRALIPATR